jgi:hypothetical protein
VTPLFADTSYFVALVVCSDNNHPAAAAWARSSHRALCTTEYVLAETGNFLSRPAWRRSFVDLYTRLKTDSQATIVPASSVLFDRGVELFGSRTDQSWSVVDCLSFVAMRDRGITEALSFDRHFEQAGFSLVLK